MLPEKFQLPERILMQQPSPDPNTIFAEILKDLPAELAALARQYQAFRRARKIKSVAELLRLVLLFAGLDWSEREIAANVVLVHPTIKSLTDQSVHERLQACLAWVQALLPALIQRSPLPDLPSGLRMLALDASDLTAPGQTKVTWRVHQMMDLLSLQMCWVQVTAVQQGETLCNCTFQAGDVVLADRGYSHRKGLAHLLESGAQAVVRYNAHHIPVADRSGQALVVAAALRDCEPGATRTLAVQFTAPNGQTHAVWLHAYRLHEAAAAAARRRCRQAGKRGKYTPKQATLWLAEFVLVLTSLAPEVLSAATVLALYRCRWQIELLFKRFKSLLDLDQLRARAASPLGQLWVCGKLLYAGLLEQRALRRCGADWTHLDGARRGTWWRVWKLLAQELVPLLTLSQCWDLRAWPAALTALAERPRQRKLQALPLAVVIWLYQPAPTTGNGLQVRA